MENAKKKGRLSPSRIIITSFIGLILTGTFLLMLPIRSVDPGGASFFDCLFTATSASCVTGLIVQDTATYWTPFGQFVIIMLIQIGGMGVVTVAMLIAKISGRRIGLARRSTMREAISRPQVGGIVRMTNFIVTGTLLIEGAGAVAFMPKFCTEFGLLKGVWYSIFHSVSAFCNAGFDLMGVKSKFSSLTSYTGDWLVNTVVILLIVVGGIGFSTWYDFKQYKFNFKKYRLQAKIALSATAILLLGGFLYFWIFEYSQPAWAHLSTSEKLWATAFQAVTPRTAGFNTTDLTALSDSGIMVTIFLMLIGGCPGSTAGGMKTATLAVLAVASLATFRRQNSTAVFGRRIDDETVRKAATLLMMYLFLFLFGAMFISIAEGLPILTCMFEAASAIGTVGLTLGITPALSLPSRLVLVALMYMGRVGGLTIIFATVKNANVMSKYPVEKITVGQ